jgi:hypothetical protein
MHDKIVIFLAVGCLLGTVEGALAQQLPPAQKGSEIPASPHTQRLYECRALARAHDFGFHFIRKGKFMRACMKLPKL